MSKAKTFQVTVVSKTVRRFLVPAKDAKGALWTIEDLVEHGKLVGFPDADTHIANVERYRKK